MLKGVDIHPSYQAGFPFRKDLIDFAIIKVTEGDMVMGGAAAMVEEARGAGLLFGVYHFLTKDDPVNQANYFVDNIANWVGEGILAVDWEQYGVTNGNNLWAFCEQVHNRTGVYPVIYTNQYDASKIDGPGGDKVKANCGLWFANWPFGSLVTGWNDPAYIGGLEGWNMALWQFGVMAVNSARDLLGYGGNDVDVDYFYGDANTWRAYANPGGNAIPNNPGNNAPFIPGPSSPNLDYSFYIVQPGDTLSDIARLYGTTWQTLQSINGLINPDLIYPGQHLRINGATGAKPAEMFYTVLDGDNLSDIAAKYGTTWQALQALNNINNPDLIYPGQVLRLA